jgi:hypothetical protein
VISLGLRVITLLGVLLLAGVGGFLLYFALRGDRDDRGD